MMVLLIVLRFPTKILACLDWQRLPNTHDIIVLEQKQSLQPLADLLVSCPVEASIKNVTHTAVKLHKSWLQLRKELVPPGSPLRI